MIMPVFCWRSVAEVFVEKCVDYRKITDRINAFVFGDSAKSSDVVARSSPQSRVRSRRLQRLIVVALFLVTLVLIGRSFNHPSVPVAAGAALSQPVASGAEAGGAATSNFEHQDYSPSSNLEPEEIAILAKARRKIDIAMYSFTDLEVANALASEARAGIRIRVYRDAEQYTQEQSRAAGRPTTSSILRAGGVEVRVKSERDLMHLKSYEVDDSFLRTGSANWSRSGLSYQDNDVVYIQLPQAVKAFESDFEAMWSRPDNLVLARP
jgi:phosphatidylserine/phosphatidylglycerophosphate/cardiolipin synthase-like enzyme